MLKVLLVDDEPFIIQGLKVLIDWEQEGYMIAGTASNGKEAYDFLKKESVDLIIADIQMPVMTGLDLQEADFEYARRALQNECTDYILKPVDRDMLLKLLNRVSAMRDEDDRMRQKNNKMEKAYLARNQIALIKGKYDDSNLQYVTSQMKCKEGVRYVEIQMAGCDADEDVTDQEMREFQRQMYECCTAFLKDYAENCVFDASADEKIYVKINILR